MEVLIVGATGRFASLVIPELKQRGVTIRALVRCKDKIDGARQQGADEAVVGDLNNADSLRAAASGMEGVYHLNPAFAPNEAELGVAMVEAAKASGVRKFVFSGVIHPSLSSLGNHAGKPPVEEALYDSGMNFTVLQPTIFMQNFDIDWQGVMEKGQFALPYSKHAKTSYVDYRDVAEVAALALTSDQLDYGTFELCAAGMVDQVELAAMMSEALDRPIEAVELTFEEWAQAAQIPEGTFREGMKKYMLTTIATVTLAAMLWYCEPFWGENPVRYDSTFTSQPAASCNYVEPLPARLQLRQAITRFAKRFPDMRLPSAIVPEIPHHGLRAPIALPVLLK